MKIGIVGYGVVGKANAQGFEELGHTVVVHDKILNTKINDVLDCDICFVCTQENAVEDVVKELFLYHYTGIVAIRSTIEPGTIDNLIERFRMPICYVPEFLRERCAYDDFVDCELLAIGTYSIVDARKIVEAYKHLPKHIEYLTPNEAEILKIYNNSYAALRIVFANIMNNLCETYNADYSIVKQTFEKTGKTSGQYLTVSKELKGFGGMCLPKDTKKLQDVLQKNNLHFDLIDAIIKDNNKFETTVFKGMRK